MYRIIGAIHFSEAFLGRHPEIKHHGVGVLAILDPNDTARGFDESAQHAILTYGGGAQKGFAIEAVEKNKDGQIALFFARAEKEEIPVGSTVTVS